MKTKASSHKSKSKEKEDENSTSEHSDGNENNFGYENPEFSSSEEPKNSEDNHAKKMNELEQRLEAISNRSNLQELRVVRPYPVEWDSAFILPGSRYRICMPSTTKVRQTNICTTSNSKQGM